jgi:hypothetical protein
VLLRSTIFPDRRGHNFMQRRSTPIVHHGRAFCASPRTLEKGGAMADGREEREEREIRIKEEKREDRSDRIERDEPDQWQPERVDS